MFGWHLVSGRTAEARLLSPTSAPMQRRPFHWLIEFPEVFLHTDNPGFDAVLGNPPFVGGQKITGNFGTDYRDFLVLFHADGRRGSADLCAYFFLRAGSLLKVGGNFGMLAVNTIAEGDTRQVGLSESKRAGKSLTLEELNTPENRSWRPFQLAFVLLNLPGVTELEHSERSDSPSAIADLLWFPTGGGKTEAYLGLTAYTLGTWTASGCLAVALPSCLSPWSFG